MRARPEPSAKAGKGERMASKIEDYGFISNLRTGALVSRNADIEWLCAPRFDSDACFASLVGYDEHGRWSMRPTQAVRQVEQRYRGDTLILDTEFTCDGGRVRVTDFMPIADSERCDVMRVVEGLEGEVTMEMLLDVRFGYGADTPWITQRFRRVAVHRGPRLDDAPHARRARTKGRARLGVSERQKGRPTTVSARLAPVARTGTGGARCPSESFNRQRRAGASGRAAAPIEGDYSEAVMRSLLTLKGLTYAPTGGIVAALTTSLPEELGGVRNWDYRFCWLRDASLTLDALMIGGYIDEARAFRDWLLRATAGAPDDLQIMYDIAGGRRLDRIRARLAARLRGLAPGARGQCGIGSVSARRLRRGPFLSVCGPQAGTSPARKTAGHRSAP